MMSVPDSHEEITMATLPARDPCKLAAAKVKGHASTLRYSPSNRNSQCKGPEVEDDFWPVSKKRLTENNDLR